MSSYNQVSESRTLAETLGLATTEIVELGDELSDLCAAIAAQFPDTYENIPKYRQAYSGFQALDEARSVLSEALERISPPDRNEQVTVTVGRQTRRNRSMSQTVRLGNAAARLVGVWKTLAGEGENLDLVNDLEDTIEALGCVEFPTKHG